MYMKVLVAIPTYNESGNVERMIRALNDERSKMKDFDVHILIADDRSPDGTAEIVKKLQSEIPNVHLSHGKKQGLGVAYSRVFEYAVAHSYEALVMMDCDFSHSPADVKNLLKALASGSSFAIGSRYVSGGSIPGDWPFIRILNTRVAGFVARYIGGLDSRIKDVTAGFRALRVEDLQKLNYKGNNAGGYSFMINLSNEMLSSGLKISEIPIDFKDRTAGESKIRTKDIVNFIIVAARLNDDSSAKQLVRYLIVGLVGTIVNLVSLWILAGLGLPHIIAAACSVELSIVNNYFGHSFMTFKAARKQNRYQLPTHTQRFPAFHGSVLVSGVIILSVSYILDSIGVYYLLAQACGIALAAAVNYLMATRLIWGRFKQSKTQISAG